MGKKNRLVLLSAVLSLLIVIGIFVGIRYLKNIPSTTTYTITLASCENGSFNIKVNDEEGLVAKKGDNITVLPIADLNYVVEKVYYTQEDSANQIEITLNNRCLRILYGWNN